MNVRDEIITGCRIDTTIYPKKEQKIYKIWCLCVHAHTKPCTLLVQWINFKICIQSYEEKVTMGHLKSFWISMKKNGLPGNMNSLSFSKP